MYTKDTLTVEQVRTLFSYDASTGEFRRLHRVGNCRRGEEPGTVTAAGYRSIKIARSSYKAHRLAWLYVHGVWPAGEIDHRNGNKLDNRLTNLRDVSHAKNKHNMTKPMRNNTTGYLGVSFNREAGKFTASIRVAGHLRYLGRFGTPEEASAVYLAAKAELHPTYIAAQETIMLKINAEQAVD